MIVDKILSGGQTGCDIAALDAALALGIPIGGYCPLGRKCEGGTIPDKYPLIEMETADYGRRTKANVEAADGTLIFTTSPLTPGTRLTIRLAKELKKASYQVALDAPGLVLQEGIVRFWIITNAIRALNVAGPRESKRPGVYKKVLDFLSEVLK